MGYIVGVVEKKATLNGDVCCTGLVSRECVDKYSIPEGVIHRWANSAKLFLPPGKPVHIQRDAPQVAVLNRSAFNQIWAQRAKKAGVEYHFGCNLKGIVREKGKVTAEVSCHGETLTLQGRAIVIATGFGTPLLDNLGLGAAGDFVMGAQAVVETDIDEVEVYFGSEVAPGFFGWLVPTSPGKGLVGLLARRDNPFYLRKLLASLAADGKIASDDVTMTYGGVPLKPLPHTCGDNLLVVGTAAGQVKPITGGGIYFGLICADIAANHLKRRWPRIISPPMVWPVTNGLGGANWPANCATATGAGKSTKCSMTVRSTVFSDYGIHRDYRGIAPVRRTVFRLACGCHCPCHAAETIGSNLQLHHRAVQPEKIGWQRWLNSINIKFVKGCNGY